MVKLLDLLRRIGELPAEVWLVPPVVILATWAVISWTVRAARLRRFRAIARRNGLDVNARIINGSDISGTFRGRALVMTLATPLGPTIRWHWTRTTVDVRNPEAITLRLWPEDLLDRAITAAGGQEVRVGDEQFDRRFVIRSSDPDLVNKMFQNPPLRERILRSGLDSVELVSSKLRVLYPREERDPEHAALLFTAIADLADAIDALKGDYRPELIQTDIR